MAEPSTEKPKSVEKQPVARQADLQIGSIGHQAASGASAGAGAPPLDGAAVTRIQRDPQHALRSDMLALQRAVGNRAVAALVRGESKEVAIQAKLEVGPVNDAYEQEADRVARMVTSGITQRKPAANVKSKDDGDDDAPLPGPAANIKRMVQRKKAESSEEGVRADGSFTTDANVHSRIRRMEGGGRPLPDTVRREMEPRFGADFSGVRIHTSGEAVQLNRDIGARAFTHGSHIAFNSGTFNPSSQDGRHLLAHELTHTIQQTGARPLQRRTEEPSVQRNPTRSTRRGPKGVIQRASTWERFKSFFTGDAPGPATPTYVEGPIVDIQAAAVKKSFDALTKAKAIIPTAKAKAAEQQRTHVNTDDSEQGLGTLTTGATREKGNIYGRAREARQQSRKGDTQHHVFLNKFQKDADDTLVTLETNYANIRMVDAEMEFAAGERTRGGPKSMGSKDKGLRPKVWRNAAIAEESEQLVKSLERQIESFSTEAKVLEGVARGGLEGSLGRYEARSIPAAEKSASDSTMTLMGMKTKVEGYFDYVKADLAALQAYMTTKEAALKLEYGTDVGARAMGSGFARSQAGDEGLLDEQEAFEMAGGAGGMTKPKEGDGEQAKSEEELVKAEFEVGKLAGKKSVEDKKAKTPKPKKPDLKKKEKAFAQQVRNMEITSMLYAKALKRVPDAEHHVVDISKLHTEANVIYSRINEDRKIESPTKDQVNQAVIKAGEARVKVAEGGIVAQKGYVLKKQIYDESQKAEYKDAVGERAMSKNKRMAKKVGGIIANAAARTVTGGLYGYSAEEEAGGYRVGIKSRTLIDDIERKKLEIEQITGGLKQNPVRGLGGKHGARAYAAFKWISFGLQIVRDISAGVALWVTLVTAGVGAPVGAVFASISVLAMIAKAAFDLLLLVWSGIGLGNTNDPRSRSILRGENTRQGLALGEGIFGLTPVVAAMGATGNIGAMQGLKQTQIFENQGLAGTLGNQGVSTGTKVGGNLLQNVGVNNLSNYTPEAGYENRKMNQAQERVRKGKTAMRVLSHPLRSAFSSLGDFINKKKRLREKKFADLIPELSKSIGELNEQVQSIPTGRVDDQQGTPLPPPQPPPVVARGESESLPEVPEVMPGPPPTTSFLLQDRDTTGDPLDF